MTLLKRGKTWWSYFYIDGVRQQHSTGTSNRKQAEIIETKLRQDANLQRFQVVQANPKLTFGELALQFTNSGSAKRHHLDRLKALLPYFCDLQIVRITHETAVEYRQYRHSQKTLSVATLNRDLIAARYVLNWGLRKQLIISNPLKGVRMERERKTKRPIVSVVEETLLLKSAAKHLQEIIICALDTGMRRIEILNQKWEDIDFHHRLLYVSRSKTAEGESREIPLTSRLLVLLTARKQTEGLVFTFGGQPLHRVKTAWKGALKRSKSRNLRLRDLRHTFNNRLIFSGVDREVRKSLMGHSDSEIHDVYIQIGLPLKFDAIKKLEAWWKQEIKGLQKHANHSPSVPMEEESSTGEAARRDQSISANDF